MGTPRPAPTTGPRPKAGGAAGVPVAEGAREDAVAAAAVSLLAQCAAMVASIDDVAYCTTSRTIRGGTIGKHVRHVLDHFRAAIGPCAGGDACIDYDRRERDVPMETDRALALAAIEELAALVRGLDGAELGSAVRVRVMLGADGAGAEVRSTRARELAFAAHHAVHHHAMVRAIAAEFGHEMPEDLGRAPSTLNHERRLMGGFGAGG